MESFRFSCAKFYFVLFLLIPSIIKAQNKSEYYPYERYQTDNNFSLTKENYNFSSLTIEVIQAKNLHGMAAGLPLNCRAWVYIKKKSKIVDSLIFPEFEPNGAPFGLFVPSVQPSKNFFCLIKVGDYDGRLILIARDGTIKKFIGGAYVLSTDKRYLFSIYFSNHSGVEVIDLKNGASLLKKIDFTHFSDKWFTKNNLYAFKDQYQPDTAYVYDIPTNVFTPKPITSSFPGTWKKLNIDFYPPDSLNCTCVKK